jgi:hypothetical protein
MLFTLGAKVLRNGRNRKRYDLVMQVIQNGSETREARWAPSEQQSDVDSSLRPGRTFAGATAGIEQSRCHRGSGAMLEVVDQLMVDEFEQDFLNSGLSIYDLTSCLAGYLKWLLVSRSIEFDDEGECLKFISVLSDVEEKRWPATETLEKKGAREYFWSKVHFYKGVNGSLSSFARCCVFCAHNDSDWADHSLGEDTPFLLYADELSRMCSGKTEELVGYFRSALGLPRAVKR